LKPEEIGTSLTGFRQGGRGRFQFYPVNGLLVFRSWGPIVSGAFQKAESVLRRYFAADLIPGLTTAAVVLPKALAYATIAQLPVQAGLFSALVPMAIYAVLGTSRVLSVSTTTPIAILCASSIGEALAADPALDPLVAAATLSILVGAILLAARALRFGFLANFISEPVLTGFKAGVGLVIIVDQLPKLLGIHIQKAGFFRDVGSIVAHLRETSWPTLTVALATLAIIVLSKRFLPKAPAPLLAVAVGIAASALVGLEASGVSVVGAIQGGLPTLKLPQPALFEAMWPAAAGIALISFTESIAAARAFVRPSDPPLDANRELFALGCANAAGAFIGSMPAGGGTSQTSVALNAGSNTQATSLVVAAAALATLLFLAPVLALMPHATLAAVVIAYSIGLVDFAGMAAIRRVRSIEFHWAVVACLGVMTLGTLKGVVAAIVLSLASLIRLTNDPRVDEIRRIPGTHHFRPRESDHPDDEAISGLLIARPVGRIYFGNAENAGAKLAALMRASAPRVFLLDCSAIPGLEYTALKMLIEAEVRLRESGVELWLAALNPEALDLVRRTELAERLGAARMFRTVEEAVAAFEAPRGIDKTKSPRF
jgi:high affinity sulfate transporter 1